MDSNAKIKTAYQITERNGKSYWNRIGVAFTNKDGSLNVKLDSMPSNFQFQLRDADSVEWREGRRGSTDAASSAEPAPAPLSALS